MQTHYPDIMSDCGTKITKKIALHKLIESSKQNRPTVNSYIIKYIGQSSQINHRLTNHSTIQKILRDIER